MRRRFNVNGDKFTRYMIEFYYNSHLVKFNFDTLVQAERFCYLNDVSDFVCCIFNEKLHDYVSYGNFHLSVTLNLEVK